MHRSDKAVLRLAIGLGLAVLIAYGLSLPAPFVVCVMTALMLCKPGPPIPFGKGVVLSLIVGALLVAGVLMVPLLENYAVTGLLLTGVLLWVVFFAGARSANPLTIIMVVAVTIIPIAGVADQALVSKFAVAFVVGIATGIFVSGVSHALFPDAPGAGGMAAAPAPVSAETASWIALRATLVVMPVFVVALTNPALYLPAVIKTTMLGQQACSTTARSAGQELVGSTLMGAVMAAVAWFALKLQPNLWMLMLWLVAAALWTGARLYGLKATSYPAVVLEQCLGDHADPAGARHRGQRQRQGCLQGFRRSHQPVHRGGVLRLGDGLGARTLACLGSRRTVLQAQLNEGSRTMLMNLTIGLPITLLCLALQAGFTFWCVRYYLRQSGRMHWLTGCFRMSARSWS